MKFGKKPRFVKKKEQESKNVIRQISSKSSSCNSNDIQIARQDLSKKRASLKAALSSAPQITPSITTIFPDPDLRVVRDLETSQCLQVSSLSTTSICVLNEKPSVISPGNFSRSMHDFYDSHPHDWKEMSEAIAKDVIKINLCVKWEDIVGLDDAKMVLRESVIYPLKYPQLFDRLQAWKGEL